MLVHPVIPKHQSHPLSCSLLLYNFPPIQALNKQKMWFSSLKQLHLCANNNKAKCFLPCSQPYAPREKTQKIFLSSLKYFSVPISPSGTQTRCPYCIKNFSTTSVLGLMSRAPGFWPFRSASFRRIGVHCNKISIRGSEATSLFKFRDSGKLKNKTKTISRKNVSRYSLNLSLQRPLLFFSSCSDRCPFFAL